MQFIVLIEFLVPGLATTLLAMALLPKGSVSLSFDGLPSGETSSALLLLAISYPVGILTNFAAFKLQRLLLMPKMHQKILASYSRLGIDLVQLAGQQLGLKSGIRLGTSSRGELRDIFNLMRAVAVSKNIERLNITITFQEGLQRFARGMLLPLTLAVAWALSRQPIHFFLAGVFVLLFVLSLMLLSYSLANEDEQVARFFVTQVNRGADRATPQPEPSCSDVALPYDGRAANPVLNRTAGAAG